MANYRKKSNSVLSVIAVILALLLIASVTIGIGMHFYGWFDTAGEEEQTEIVNEEAEAQAAVSDMHQLTLDNVSSQFSYVCGM